MYKVTKLCYEQILEFNISNNSFVSPGPYAICLDNTMSRMASKLVYVFLVTYVEEEWSQYRKEIEDVELTVSNFTVSKCF